MSVIHPSPHKVRALQERWVGEEKRLQAIARSMLADEDWTAHLRGLPFVSEIPPLAGEECGRDLRGANLGHCLHPGVEIRPAVELQGALIAGITLEAMCTNTPLEGMSPFPVEAGSAEEMTLAIRRGDAFLLAYCGSVAVGVVRLAERREFRDLTDERSYTEISGLAVLRPYRRNGIAGVLLEAAEERAREDRNAYTLLRTTMEVGLVPYYERLGYAVVRVRQLAYQDAPAVLDVVMTKRMDLAASTGMQSNRFVQPKAS